MDYRRASDLQLVCKSLMIEILADHWEDVLVGSIVGTSFSFFAYRQYFPPLGSPNANLPYPPRVVREVQQAGLADTVRLSSIRFNFWTLNYVRANMKMEIPTNPNI